VPSSSGSEVVELSAEASGSGKSSAERLKVMRVTRRATLPLNGWTLPRTGLPAR